MSSIHLTLYCEHISKSHVHCNKYKKLHIGMDETPLESIEETDWGIVDGEVRCDDHIN